MAPLRGWAPRGERLARPRCRMATWKTMTFLAALRCDRLEAPALLDCLIDGELFRLYVERVLVPTLRPGDVVVMDNLAGHKTPLFGVRSRAVGARLFLLPKYSPDLNPIEKLFAKLKHLAPQGRSPHPGTPSAPRSPTSSSTPSPQASAATTLSRQAMPRPELIPLAQSKETTPKSGSTPRSKRFRSGPLT